MFLIIAKIYARLQKFLHDIPKINLPGFGVILSQIKRDYIINYGKNKLYFNHKVARAYGRLISGIFNEPETHLFIKRLINKIDFKINFIDVGASVGEFVIDMAGYDKVNSIFAFEPIYEAYKSIQVSCIINDFKHVKVFNQVLSEDGKPLAFFYDKKSPMGSKIFQEQKNNLQKYMIDSTTLDLHFSNLEEPSILLIDVEGAELSVLKGGRNFTRNNFPLIIFEYNEVSKKYFDLEDIQIVLGKNYKIYRLKSDGYLDENYGDTWNMVAVHSSSSFFSAVISMVK